MGVVVRLVDVALPRLYEGGGRAVGQGRGARNVCVALAGFDKVVPVVVLYANSWRMGPAEPISAVATWSGKRIAISEAATSMTRRARKEPGTPHPRFLAYARASMSA